MTQSNDKSNLNRRQFIKQGAALSAGAAVLGSVPKNVFAADDQTIRLALIGCGGRGTGAVGNALSVPDSGPIKLWAMADLHESKIKSRHDSLKKRYTTSDGSSTRSYPVPAGKRYGPESAPARGLYKDGTENAIPKAEGRTNEVTKS